jgi:hypothetical protein
MFEQSCQFQLHRICYRLHRSCSEAGVTTYSTIRRRVGAFQTPSKNGFFSECSHRSTLQSGIIDGTLFLRLSQNVYSSDFLFEAVILKRSSVQVFNDPNRRSRFSARLEVVEMCFSNRGQKDGQIQSNFKEKSKVCTHHRKTRSFHK